ncbi:hypothetical protein FQN60_009108 [Etheostoma spectabile]|uniref:Uncharacterized protein n=1 Tax=Etheostoma spectabile TaxID=54343 RepID=A0A5J5CK48_9PERO|nr:hypothetical protein FQN60_009108 [Etheostoma spectabile]
MDELPRILDQEPPFLPELNTRRATFLRGHSFMAFSRRS